MPRIHSISTLTGWLIEPPILAFRFEFPLELDMWKYTVEGLAERDAAAADGAPAGASKTEAALSADVARPSTLKAGAHGMQYLYQLKGVVVHSGTANVGHYYSYIKVSKFCISPSLNQGHEGSAPQVTWLLGCALCRMPCSTCRLLKHTLPKANLVLLTRLGGLEPPECDGGNV